MSNKKKNAVRRGETPKGEEDMLKKILELIHVYNALYAKGNDSKELICTTIAEQAVHRGKAYAYSQQFNQDISMMALYEEFGFADERQKRFYERFNKIYDEFRNIEILDMQENDKGLWNYWAELETRLKMACGKYFVPMNHRYNVKFFYGDKLIDTLDADSDGFDMALMKGKEVRL